MFHRGGLSSYDPASGKERWKYPWKSRTYESVNGATPLVVGSLSAPARAALLPWLPVEAALLCLTIAPALATLRAAARDRRRAKLGLLLGEGAAVDQKHE